MKSAARQSSSPSSLLFRLVRFSLLLLPLTALIVTRESRYSYTLGKSVFFRVVIEILLPLCAVLSFLSRREERFRPPCTMLTWAVSVYTAAVLLTTVLSLDPVQSWWGTLERTDGAFATLHFLALFLLLASAFRAVED